MSSTQFFVSPSCPLVYIIVLNYNNLGDTIETLESVEKIVYGNFRVLLVDNNSRNEILAEIMSRFPEIELLKNKENLGYAGGNNVGIRRALDRGSEYVLILNNDVIVERDLLLKMVPIMERDELCAASQPVVTYYHNSHMIWSAGTEFYFGYPRLWCKNKPLGNVKNSHPPFGLVGCALLMRASAIQRIGAFDASLFLMQEETEWCMRANKNGYTLSVIGEAVVQHKVSASLKLFSDYYLYYIARNWLLVAKKHFSFPLYLYVLVTELLLRLPYYVYNLTLRHQIRMIRYYFKGLRDGIVGVSGKVEL